jgi:hypothetical protein
VSSHLVADKLNCGTRQRAGRRCHRLCDQRNAGADRAIWPQSLAGLFSPDLRVTTRFSSKSFEQSRHFGAIRYQSLFYHVKKQAMFYNLYNTPNTCAQRIGILDLAALTIMD